MPLFKNQKAKEVIIEAAIIVKVADVEAITKRSC